MTVAVLPILEESEYEIPESEITWEAVHGSGSGGQNKNRRATAIRMKHEPTGITVWNQDQRDQEQNRRAARRELQMRVREERRNAREQCKAESRKNQVGTGQRGDKVRTIRMQDGMVRDHRTGRRTSVDRYLDGHVEDVA